MDTQRKSSFPIFLWLSRLNCSDKLFPTFGFVLSIIVIMKVVESFEKKEGIYRHVNGRESAETPSARSKKAIFHTNTTGRNYEL